MTDLELKELVASLALAQRKTDEQQAETQAEIEKLLLSQRKTDGFLAKTEELLAEIAVENKKLLLSQQKTDAQQAKTDKQIAKTNRQMSKTDEKLDRLAEMYGGVANNQGAVTEEFFFNSLGHNPVLRGIHFEFVYKSLSGNRQGIQGEYDIVLSNGQDVLIIEVKYKAHPNDPKTLIDKKAANFKTLFPFYKDHKMHLGLASFHLDDKTIQSALEQGVTVLQRKGDLIETTPATPLH